MSQWCILRLQAENPCQVWCSPCRSSTTSPACWTPPSTSSGAPVPLTTTTRTWRGCCRMTRPGDPTSWAREEVPWTPRRAWAIGDGEWMGMGPMFFSCSTYWGWILCCDSDVLMGGFFFGCFVVVRWSNMLGSLEKGRIWIGNEQLGNGSNTRWEFVLHKSQRGDQMGLIAHVMLRFWWVSHVLWHHAMHVFRSNDLPRTCFMVVSTCAHPLFEHMFTIWMARLLFRYKLISRVWSPEMVVCGWPGFDLLANTDITVSCLIYQCRDIALYPQLGNGITVPSSPISDLCHHPPFSPCLLE